VCVRACAYIHFPNMGAHPAYATQCCRGSPRQFLFGDTGSGGGESNDGDEDVATPLSLPTLDESLSMTFSSEDGDGSSTTSMPVVVVDDEGSSIAFSISEDDDDDDDDGTAYGFEYSPSVEERKSGDTTYVKSSSPGIVM